MKTAVVFAFIGLCVLSALSLAEDLKKSKPSATVSPAGEFSAITTTTTPKPTTTTPKPTTTTPKPTTTTPKPTTTTPKPTTTTPKPTTTTPKPTTTTPKPTTTTPKPTTTTPKPTTTTPKPTTTTSPTPTAAANVSVGNYTLLDDKKVMCVMAQMALQIRLATPKANGTFIVQPNMVKTKGTCQDTKVNLTLAFKEGFITFTFNKSVANNTVYVDTLSFSLSYPFSKGGNGEYSANNKSMQLFPTKIGHSYSCKNQSLYMGNGLYLEVTQDRMQAFNLTKSNEFGLPDPCPADLPNYSVAIGVGVTLLVLIVVVVVVYLLSRRKRADGYQSL
ncbi:macrosialin isoform X6 [Dicentrarchus labrax]|uniref:macrosialin isoform X4 n=1 Tax=Dicentrarchus labrax TaxID=13489 RepID=UPI0021F501AA|nr:macrosialin isoform X4 [Dicentrarchus labrax]XP_051284535.1 macrosialin isoform X6 [Dicentrarchus labrax]